MLDKWLTDQNFGAVFAGVNPTGPSQFDMDHAGGGRWLEDSLVCADAGTVLVLVCLLL